MQPLIFHGRFSGVSVAATDTSWQYAADVAFYHDNRWAARPITGLPADAPIANADTNQHHRVLRRTTLLLSATYGASEGPGMSIGGAWQVYDGAAWQTIGTHYDVSTGRMLRKTAEALVTLNAGEYLRFACRVSDAGANNYPGARPIRILMREIVRGG